MVKLAKANNAEAVDAGRLEVVQGGAAELPWPDDTFDCGACVAAFLFFDEPVTVLREIKRVLKPGGRFLIVTPAKKKSPIFPRLVGGTGKQVRFYSAEEMQAMVAEAGFSLHDVSVKSGRLHCLVRIAK
jgi:ubiquinone/menaquinone biosynthesis C-methylase UbiE